MFEGIISFFKKFGKGEMQDAKSKDTAKERLHLVLMQDRANVSADFLEMMKQEIIDVIKKYINVDESEIDVRLTNKTNEDGTSGAPALYANIPIISIKDENKNTVKELKNSDNNEEKSNREEKGAKKSVTKKEESAKENKDIKEASKKIEKRQDSKEDSQPKDDNKDKLKELKNNKKETEKKEEDNNKKKITSKKTSTKKVTKKTTTKNNA